MKILVVEDEPELLRFYKLLLEDLGHNVFLTKDGQECLDAYRMSVNANNTFDLVILDHRIPKKNGMEVAKEIASTNPSQKLLMITAFAGLLDLKESPKQLKIIQKPFDVDDLVRTMKEMTE